MPNRAKLALGLALLMGLPVLAVSTKFSELHSPVGLGGAIAGRWP